MSDSQFRLLGERRFGPFFLTQFFGALNDNVYKNALLILITFGVAGLDQKSASLWVNIAAGLFILPFFLFSAQAGQLAERYPKDALIRAVKLAEIGIMTLGAVALWLHSLPMLIAILFLMGAQSSLFGPVKYSIMPQHLDDRELVGGNALVEAGTFLAILIGTMLGGVLIALKQGPLIVGATVIAVAVAGYLAARRVPYTPASAPELKLNWNTITETVANLRFLRTERTVFLSTLGISWFWFYGATLLAQLPNYTKTTLGGNEQVVTLALVVFSVGIGIGSLLCERLSGHRIEIGLVPFGSIGLTLLGIDLVFAVPPVAAVTGQGARVFLQDPAHWHVLVDLLLIGAFGGLYIVPLYALVQQRSAPSHRSRVIAGLNILNALFMVASAILAIILLGAGLTIPQLLLTVAVMNAAVAIFIYTLVPEFLMRFLSWILISLLYRVRPQGLERIPEDGPAILVCNHVSFVDALIIMASVRRPVRFVMYHKIFQIPVLSFMFRTARCIPIAPARENAELLRRAYDEIDAALAAGELVGLFPEGGLTPDGEVQEFKPGIERILKRRPVPVVPMALRGLWRSMWSRRHQRLHRSRLPRRFRARIELLVADARAAEAASAAELQAVVTEVRGVQT